MVETMILAKHIRDILLRMAVRRVLIFASAVHLQGTILPPLKVEDHRKAHKLVTARLHIRTVALQVKLIMQATQAVLHHTLPCPGIIRRRVVSRHITKDPKVL